MHQINAVLVSIKIKKIIKKETILNGFAVLLLSYVLLLLYTHTHTHTHTHT